ncbi:hypothetical protein N2152v2_007778 [Parachlorella kessleri]
MGVLSWVGSKFNLSDQLGNLNWTPAQIPNQSGKVYIVTGGNSGIGYEVARNLLERNARVIIASRDLEKCKKAAQELQQKVNSGKVEAAELNLASMGSIRSFADDFASKGLPLNCLVCNAGVFLPPYAKTEWGSEVSIGVNYVGHFVLTHLLMEQLKAAAPSRVIWVASPAEASGVPDLSDPLGYHRRDSGLISYGTSKEYMIMAAVEMQRRGQGLGIDHFPVQPGLVGTPLLNMDPDAQKLDPKKPASWLMWTQDKLFAQGPEKGCWSTLYAATNPELQGHGPSYYGPLYILPQPLNFFNTAKLNPHSKHPGDPAATAKLYDETAKEVEKVLGSRLPNVLRQHEAAAV